MSQAPSWAKKPDKKKSPRLVTPRRLRKKDRRRRKDLLAAVDPPHLRTRRKRGREVLASGRQKIRARKQDQRVGRGHNVAGTRIA